jgi:Gas vesicle synthesis protein GvpL/GvpF
VTERDPALDAIRDAIEAFAAERAPDLVAEARADAIARVRSTLADAMASSLLAHCSSQMATPGRRTPESSGARPRAAAKTSARPRAAAKTKAPAPSERRGPAREEPARAKSAKSAKDMGHYVYGVIGSAETDLPPDLTAVDPEHPVELVRLGGLAAITSRVSLAEFGEEELRENLNDLEWLEEKARAHEAVLEAALARMTVVPLRMCTIYLSEAQVRDMLDRERALLDDALRRLEHKSEWGVKLICEPGALLRAASEEETAPGEHDVTEGTAYMNRKRREAQARDEEDRVAAAWAQKVHERLASLAAEAHRNPLQSPEVSGHEGEMLLNGAYLVADADLERFRERVDLLDVEFGRLGAAVELTGPWPPYNFVQEPLEAVR